MLSLRSTRPLYGQPFRINSHRHNRLRSLSVRYSCFVVQGETLRQSNCWKRYFQSGNPRKLATVSDTFEKKKNSVSDAATHLTRKETFLLGSTGNYLDGLYLSWLQNPSSVDPSWQTYFDSLRNGASTQKDTPEDGIRSSAHSASRKQHISAHLKVHQLIEAYRTRGHYGAKIDPLNLQTEGVTRQSDVSRSTAQPSELDPSYYGFTEEDMDTHFTLHPDTVSGFTNHSQSTMTLRDIIRSCKNAYVGSYGVEYTHIPDRAKREWLRDRLEVPQPVNFSKEEKSRLLDTLIWSTTFERFLAAKFPNEKRFGLDGAEGLAPALQALIDRCADAHGVESIILGSCHRGRLTLSAALYGKSPQDIFAEFAGRVDTDPLPGDVGDVKYHLGHDGYATTGEGRRVAVSLLANPSHLEAVDPVATGKAFATQELHKDTEKNRVMCLALHGDAAFAGQGVAYETLGLSRLPSYDVGGTIRVIVNNQIGFTTDVESSRSTVYASDLAKFMEAPIFHVNGDDVESAAHLCRIAADWRAEFKSDIVVDIVCYRKFGHNEFDQPSFTQPLMYQHIQKQKSCLDQYIDKLVDEGVFSRAEIKERIDKVWDSLQILYDETRDFVTSQKNQNPQWMGLLPSNSIDGNPRTSVEEQTVQRILEKSTEIPDDFTLHSGLQRVVSSRKSCIQNEAIDWSTAESLALGSLLLEGHPVRLTGQDVQRGTFSQRHSVWHDQTTGRTWTPLNHLDDQQALLTVANSPLSEYGAMGFEYGVTLADPQRLAMWEAQFGDFSNGAQIIIDNFLAAAESKWLDYSGLVLSLPHGYDGQGAEHSSARLERFLSLCNEEGCSWPTSLERLDQDANMEIVCMTTPANYFHVLRRQMKRDYRKPLIIFFSKSLLRHPLVRSEIGELSGDSEFQKVIADPAHGTSIRDPSEIDRVILCSGQIYYALTKQREALGLRNIAVTRIEQLHPFPWEETRANLETYPNAKSVVWAQEEPYNGGAWGFVRDRIDAVLAETHGNGMRASYVGRRASAATATGIKKVHAVEEQELIQRALDF